MDKTRGYEENRLVTGIFEAAQRETRLHGMGTTMVALLAVRDACLIGHVGDSRVYRLRGNSLEQLTEDHSLLNDYIKMKSMMPEEIENFPHKTGDLYIMCSDGLCGPADDDEIRDIVMAQSGNLRDCSQALIDRANEKGGPDNITVVLCRWVGSS